MAATRYIVSATASYPAKTLARKESAVREADMRAKGDRENVTVVTSSGKLVHTSTPLGMHATRAPQALPADGLEAALEVLAQDTAAEAPQVPAADAKADCGCLVERILVSDDHDPAICLDLIAARTAAEAQERRTIAAKATQAGERAAQKKRTPRSGTQSADGRGGRRATQGPASAAGWELLYDKPKQNCEVGRSADGRYALICKTHAHVQEVPILMAERALRRAGDWCPSCTAAA